MNSSGVNFWRNLEERSGKDTQYFINVFESEGPCPFDTPIPVDQLIDPGEPQPFSRLIDKYYIKNLNQEGGADV